METKFNASIKLDGKKHNAFDVDCKSLKVDITEQYNGYIYRRMVISNPSDENSAQITQPKVIDMCLPCNGEVKLHSVAGSHSNWESFLSIDENIEVGQVSEPFESLDNEGRSGNTVYKIVKVDKVLPSHPASFNNDYSLLLGQAKNVKAMAAIDEFINSKIKSTHIIIDPLFKDCVFEREGWETKYRK